MVAPDGSIYYVFTRSGKLVMRAVTAEGTSLWKTAFDFSSHRHPPALSPSGAWLFWEDHILHVEDGTELAPFLQTDVSQYLTGADSRIYARAGNILNPLTPTETGLEPAREVGWWLFGKLRTKSVEGHWSLAGCISPRNLGGCTRSAAKLSRSAQGTPAIGADGTVLPTRRSTAGLHHRIQPK